MCRFQYSAEATSIVSLSDNQGSDPGEMNIVATMNAGFIPHEIWVHNDGGRIVGEGCHIIDLMLYLEATLVIKY